MAYGKSQMIGWVQGQVDNIVENYILIYIAKHNPAYDTMPENIPHWENELAAAMGVIIGKEAACSRSAIIRGVHHLLVNLEELDRNRGVIYRKTWRKMRKEHIDQGSPVYHAAVTALMRAVQTDMAPLIGGIDPDAIDNFISAI
jgi:hypothetical protein